MQRLNVGFSRAKETMVFVHSMPIADYSDTRLGDALKHYANIRAATHDVYMTLGGNGKEKSLIIEYDGVEFHTRKPDIVTAHNFGQEYLEYDVQRQLELESFGYTFLRINKFSLLPQRQGESPADVLSGMLERAFS